MRCEKCGRFTNKYEICHNEKCQPKSKVPKGQTLGDLMKKLAMPSLESK